MVEQAKLKLDLVGKPVNHTNYRSMIGSLMYVTSSRQDIMFATCMCARYQANPNEHHVSAVKRIFHYLKGTINLGLWYPKDFGFDLSAYSDADHAGCHLDRKIESEYVAVSRCCVQVLWMRTQLKDNGFFYDKVPIYCDSKSAISISCNPYMRTRNSYFPNNSSVTILRRRNKRRTPNIVEPELRTIVEVAPMADNRIMEELLQAPTEGYEEAIVIPKINGNHFAIKTNLLQLVQANPYHGFGRENPHTHINNFKSITSTLKLRDVPNDVIKLMMFSYSFDGSARIWYDKEPPNSILTWEDLSMPRHGFTKLAQIDTFYNGLNDNDQDSLNAAAGGNLLSKTTREALKIIEIKSKLRYSRNKPNVSRMNTTSRENASKTDDRIDKLADQISTLVDIFAKKVVTPATVKMVEESYVTCGGPHAYYNCPNTDSNQPSVYATMGTYNQVALQNRASNYMAPLGFAPVQNNSENRFNQNQGQGNNFNRGNNFHGNQPSQVPIKDFKANLFKSYCCWFNITVAGSRLMLLDKVDAAAEVLKNLL
uniref:Uncharacterized mitochondrial protein AtMg00810-like n=1 Tax=Tanacetum cinerariifolium TaxID=118510 RepID=A0A6L2L5N8_TANCI|nr:uncharacterized mitochondrial protein AtMg00810-like [Tanacetum cinerariifolium]